MAKNPEGASTDKVTETVPDFVPPQTNTEIVRMINNEQLKNIASFEDAVRLAEEMYGSIAGSDLLGNGFAMVEKDALVGQPFVIVDTSVKDSEKFKREGQPAQWAIIRLVTKDHKKYIITDGSTGLCNQIIQWRSETGRPGGFMAFKGLRVSEYDYTDEKGNTSPAKTYYIDESGL